MSASAKGRPREGRPRETKPRETKPRGTKPKKAEPKKAEPKKAELENLEFLGFPKKGLRFLDRLSRNNDKAWFDAHRAEYEANLREPARAFVHAMGPRLRRLGPALHAIPRVGGSIARINRDVRFVRDKRPYKNHVAFLFWEGEVRSSSPSILYVRLRADSLALHVGNHGFTPEQLSAYRDVVSDPRRAGGLSRMLSKSVAQGYSVEGPMCRRIPRGFAEDERTAELLLYRGLYLALESKLPAEVGSEEFVDYCCAHFKALVPLHRWLVRALGD